MILTYISIKQKAKDVLVCLQQYETAGGIINMEIEPPGYFYVIAEAKRGWNLVNRDQLDREARLHDPNQLLFSKGEST